MKPATSYLPVLLLSCAGAVACGGAQSEPAAPADETHPAQAGAGRPSVTAQECEAGGGSVVGDIGDGAIHRPDYKCASGAAPTGSVRPAEGGPVAIEGSVCCPK